jgi:hypothetical protein
MELLELPDYTSPEGAPLWKPLATELMERMKKRGLADAAMVGIFCDGKPAKSVVDYWKEVLPGLPWVSQGHGLQRGIHGVPMGYCTTVWNAAMAMAPEKRRTYGWRRKEFVAQFSRDMWKPAYGIQLVESRMIGERNITGQQRGFGRMSADFWRVLKGGKRGPRSLSARYANTSWAQCNLYQTPFLAFTPGGPVQSTVRFEMIREGVQECEARIFIEQALLDKDLRAKLGEERAARLQAVLDARTQNIINMNEVTQPLMMMVYVCADRHKATSALYAAAAEVQEVLGGE